VNQQGERKGGTILKIRRSPYKNDRREHLPRCHAAADISETAEKTGSSFVSRAKRTRDGSKENTRAEHNVGLAESAATGWGCVTQKEEVNCRNEKGE